MGAYMAVGMRSIDPTFVYATFVASLYADRMGFGKQRWFDAWFDIDNYGVRPKAEIILNPNWRAIPTCGRTSRDRRWRIARRQDPC